MYRLSPSETALKINIFIVMTTIELLGGLTPYSRLLTALCDSLTQRSPGHQYSGTVSLSYDTITVKLGEVPASEADRRSSSGDVQCSFVNRGQLVFFSGLYCQVTEYQKEIEDLILQHTPTTGLPWNPAAQDNVYSAAVVRYLAIADGIAAEGYNCSSGDHYRPGYFSEVVITDNDIELKQINHWNARSLDHKENYHLRNLEFVIPLKLARQKSSRHDYAIGDMTINFSDRSSANNRHCGDKIREKIEAEMLKFK
jgi:hypothetical protein